MLGVVRGALAFKIGTVIMGGLAVFFVALMPLGAAGQEGPYFELSGWVTDDPVQLGWGGNRP